MVRCVETRSVTIRNVALRQSRWVTLNFVELGSVGVWYVRYVGVGRGKVVYGPLRQVR